MMSKNRLAIIAVIMILLLAVIPTALGATPSKTSHYQDTAWRNFVISQNEKTTADFNDLSIAIKDNDYKEIYSAAHRVFIDEGISLEKSKKYNVSPRLKNVKAEYERASSDFKMAGKYYMAAANKLKGGDITGRDTEYKSAVAYSNSGVKHLNNLVKYLDGSSSKTPQKSQSNSDSNSISNTPKTTNTGSGSIIANSNTKVYHNAGCRYVSTIKPEHLTYFNNRQEAEADGYRACKVCGG
jgi:hypothetical protein